MPAQIGANVSIPPYSTPCNLPIDAFADYVTPFTPLFGQKEAIALDTLFPLYLESATTSHFIFTQAQF